MKKLLSSALAVLMAASLAGCGTGDSTDSASARSGDNKDSGVVNIYTARHYDTDDLVYQAFTEETGIKVNVVKGKEAELIERLKREGENTEADLFVTVDGGVLNNAKETGVLQTVTSDVIEKNVPEQFRDKDNQWIGISTRARVIAYSKDRVKPEDLSTYEDLTSDKWKGKILVRSSSSLYNQSLLASFIELNGEDKAQKWAESIVANMARTPEGGDRDQAKAIAAGVGDVAIMNTYYVGLMVNSKDPEEAKVGQNLGVFFPNQETTGAHLNISGIALTKHSKNKENAIKLIEYITSKEAQSQLSQGNYEFPVNKEAEMPELLKSWGEFKAQEIDYAALGTYNKKALEIFNKVAWK